MSTWHYVETEGAWRGLWPAAVKEATVSAFRR
jgi:hypothetical protein